MHPGVEGRRGTLVVRVRDVLGFSGNLGFPLPENWSFNQIHEYEFQAGWGLDHNIWRDGSDPGVSAVGQE